jgi:lipoyl(octanoyl) transferase
MVPDERQSVGDEPVVEFRLLGRLPFEAGLALQNRLVYEAGGLCEPRIVVLFCEHPQLITVGRCGSRGHIRWTDQQLKHERLAVRWISRGGGCILHSPGQLAVYPIVPLERLGWTVGDYLRRLQRALLDACETFHVRAETRPGSFGVWGRSGQLAGVGVAVRNWVTLHGFFLNVAPAMRCYAFVETFPQAAGEAGEKTTMGCLLADRHSTVTMTKVRAALVESLAAAFGSQRYHVFTGHPWLTSTTDR